MLKFLARLSVGILFLLLIVYIGGPQSIELLFEVQLFPCLGVLIATALNCWVIALRWGALTHDLLGRHLLPVRQYFFIFVASRAVGFVVPKDLSDVGFRTYWVSRIGQVPYATCGGAVILERLFDFLLVFFGFVGTLPFFFGLMSLDTALVSLLGSIGLLGLLIAMMPTSFSRAVAYSANLALEGLARIPLLQSHIPQRVEETVLLRVNLQRSYVLTCVKFFLTVGRLILIAMAFELALTPPELIVATPASQGFYLLAFTPGGLGIHEFGWVASLTLLGAPATVVTAFAIAHRLLITFAICLLAVPSLFFLRLRRSKPA